MLISIAASLVAAAPAHATFPGPVGKIAYSDLNQIWTVNADGTGVTPITDGRSAYDTEPAWSPDGNYIAFRSSRQPQGDGLYVMRADGWDVRRLPTTCSDFHAPSWSADGTKIVYHEDCLDGISVSNVSGTGSARLTTGGGSPDTDPSWSPDGTKIAFVQSDELWTMNPDGTAQTRVLASTIGCCLQQPNWSPDSTKIAFSDSQHCLSCTAEDIYTVSRDGTNVIRLTTSLDRDLYPVWSPDGARIMFSSWGPCSGSICDHGLYVMDADGTDNALVTRGLALASRADWQAAVGPPLPPIPDYLNKIGFIGAADGSVEIWTMNPDGTRQQPISNNNFGEASMRWSPDGTRIAFASSIYAGFSDIYVMNADGTGETNLTPESGGHGYIDPTWSPDGTKIAYARELSDTYELWTMNADGSGKTLLLAAPPGSRAYAYTPAWSPDGQWIAFRRNVPGVGGQIAKVRPDGTGQAPITTGSAGSDESPDWSPDGGRITFVRYSDSGGGSFLANVWTMNADGTNEQQLTTAGATDPSWSPDGTEIAFTQFVSGQGSDIWVMYADGSAKRDVTNRLVNESHPDWRPVFGYPRPKAASPIYTPLVPAYRSCASPNRVHATPLNFGSCSAPQPVSPNLTSGTPDANSRAANGTGFVRLVSIGEVPINLGNGNQSNVLITVSLSDVRRQSDLSDYTGELSADLTLKVTDRDNAPSPSGTNAGTGQPVHLRITVPCATTSDTGVGSLCSISTSANSVVPGSVIERKRGNWELGAVDVFDGGADGDAETTADNALFQTQGLFVP